MEGNKSPPKWEWTRFKNQTGRNRNFKPREWDEKPTPNKSDKVHANTMSPQRAMNPPKASGSGNNNGQKRKFGQHPTLGT